VLQPRNSANDNLKCIPGTEESSRSVASCQHRIASHHCAGASASTTSRNALVVANLTFLSSRVAEERNGKNCRRRDWEERSELEHEDMGYTGNSSGNGDGEWSERGRAQQDPAAELPLWSEDPSGVFE
jgi:hypothetical protein